jgi:hypothetical protein
MGRRTKVILGLVVVISAAVLVGHWLSGSEEPASVILDPAREGEAGGAPSRTRGVVSDKAAANADATEDALEKELSEPSGSSELPSRPPLSSSTEQSEEGSRAQKATAPEQAERASPFLGSLTKESIDEGVRDQLPAIRECYQGWLGQNPNLEGTVRVKFVIGTSEDDPELGVVQAVDVLDTTLGHVWMEGCVLSVMEEAEFEAPSSGVVIVHYPFQFNSDEE